MRVSEARFAGADLTRPRIARETDDGWQMLPTKIVGRSDGQLVLQARTPGFSRFAVFATPEVRYTWKLGNETVTAEELRTRFDEPGFHKVTLTVIDALGRSNTATFRILVNDRPAVSIEVPPNRPAGEQLRLRANVTNEVGNATVAWTFPDGSQQTGSVARYTFRRGEHPVRVTVEDEHGASTTVEETAAIGTVAEAELVIDRIAGSLSMELALGLVALVSFLLATLLLRVLPRGRSGRSPLLRPPFFIPSFGTFVARSHAPRIVAFEDPTVDTQMRTFRIGRLHIEDPDDSLETVDISVHDSRGNEVAHKTVDVGRRADYVRRDEVVPPKSRVYVREDEEYTVEVRAGGDGRWTGRSRSHVRAPASIGAIA